MTVRAPTHVLRVKLQDEPSIVREIELPSDRKLVNLAQGIVRAFDFDFDHAFGFYSALKGHVMRSQPNTNCSPTWTTPPSACELMRRA
jgi:hypothetical protein